MSVQMVEYLKNIVELEKAVYTQTQMIQRVISRMARLGSSKLNLNEPPVFVESESELKHTIGMGAIFALAGFFVAGFPKLTCIIGLILGGIIGGLIGYAMDRSKKAAEDEKQQLMYGAELARYNEEKWKEETRVRKVTAERQQLDELLRSITAKKKETMALLRKFYSMNIIYPKYQNFVAVSSFYEYFSSGRCSTLEGHEGAYNIYENEIRMELILTKLDVVIQKLDQIRTNQYVLYDALSEGNRISRQLADASMQQALLMKSVSENTELAAYYSRQTAAEANQMKWLMLYQHWDGK